MSKKIKKLIKKHKQSLAFRVEIITGPGVKTLEIQTDQTIKIHKIYIPDSNVRDIEILHELGHAALAETTHPLFSITEASFIAIPNYSEMMNTILPVMRAADDWFVDHWLFNLAPDEVRIEIDEHYKMALNKRTTIDVQIEYFMFAALMISQAEKYMGRKTNMAGDIKKAVDVFLSIDPEKPTVRKLKALINGLLDIYSPYTIELSGDRWEIIAK